MSSCPTVESARSIRTPLSCTGLCSPRQQIGSRHEVQHAVSFDAGEQRGGQTQIDECQLVRPVRVRSHRDATPRPLGKTEEIETQVLTIGIGVDLHRLVELCRDAEHARSEEHTSELQSPCNLVCRLLLEKKKT